jgi:hypothetical protein
MTNCRPAELPRTVQEAVERLRLSLSLAEQEAIAAKREAGLIDLHFGLGARIRNEFGLWQGNPALLLDCQRLKLKDMANIPDSGVALLHPDEAAMVIIRALWTRLRH